MKRGFTLLEVLVACVILGILVAAIFPVIGWLIKKARQAQYDSQAARVVQAGTEAAYSVLQADWGAMVPGMVYSPQVVVTADGPRWGMSAGESQVEARFWRRIVVNEICREPQNGEQTACGGVNIVDGNSKEVVTTVRWLEEGNNKEISARLLVVKLDEEI